MGRHKDKHDSLKIDILDICRNSDTIEFDNSNNYPEFSSDLFINSVDFINIEKSQNRNVYDLRLLCVTNETDTTYIDNKLMEIYGYVTKKIFIMDSGSRDINSDDSDKKIYLNDIAGEKYYIDISLDIEYFAGEAAGVYLNIKQII